MGINIGKGMICPIKLCPGRVDNTAPAMDEIAAEEVFDEQAYPYIPQGYNIKYRCPHCGYEEIVFEYNPKWESKMREI